MKGVKLLTLTVFFLLFASISPAIANDSTHVERELQRVRALQASGQTEEALQLCDSIRATMDESFKTTYNNEIVPVRIENDAHEVELEADVAAHELMLRTATLAIALCGVGFVLFFFIRKENKVVQRSEIQMKAAVERAELAEKSKSMFLSNMTHEIRTPLNAIAGFSDVLTYPDIDDEIRKESADIIEMNSNLLQNLINDVVNTACMDLHEMPFRMVPCDVIKLCRNVTEMIAKIKKTDAELFFETNINENKIIIADPLRLQQVLVNVLVNATKFCKQGSITLRVEDKPDDKMVYISVTDTGIGIPKDKQASIFKRFERVKESAEGFGLGLSICQFIIERFGGTIWVDGEYTEGARFIFTLPYGNPNEEGGMEL